MVLLQEKKEKGRDFYIHHGKYTWLETMGQILIFIGKQIGSPGERGEGYNISFALRFT